MRRVVWGVLMVVAATIILAVKSGIDADNYISRCLDETSGSYISDKAEHQAACK
jgi:hypothetical protein